jgi:hypothetical protein
MMNAPEDSMVPHYLDATACGKDFALRPRRLARLPI